MSGQPTLLHATDFSESASYAFGVAALFARQRGARLVVVHVAQPVSVVAHRDTARDRVAGQPADRLQDQLEQLQADDPRVTVEHRLEYGDPAEETLRLARETSAELVIVGTRGRSALMQLLVGGTAQRIMRDAPCPVLVVESAGRPPDGAAHRAE